MVTNVYIDGFNFYYGCIKNTAYKWLDFAAFCRNSLPQEQIHRIRYFTAKVRGTPKDPQQPQRQDTYLRALRTIPNLSIHEGHFLSHRVRMPLAHPPANGPSTAEVIKTEEKGSDVNLATLLLCDAFDGDFELAIVVSNDSDLVEPIRVVKGKFGLAVGVLNPHKNTCYALKNIATFYRPIRPRVLQVSQFPVTLQDVGGKFTKPSGW